MFSSQYQKSIFDQPSAYLFDSVSDREYTAETVKKRLDELKELEKRLQETKQEFTQLAIATRLKSECTDDLCETDRRKPVSFNVRWRQMSNGRLLIVELTNRLPSAALIDWTVIIRVWPLVALDTSELGEDRRNLCSRSYTNALPRLDAGATVAFEIYCKIDGPMDLETAFRPFVVQCQLSRRFKMDMAGSIVAFGIGTTILGANDLVYERSATTFALDHPKTSDQNDTERDEVRFCIAKSLLHLLRPGSFNVRCVVEWLFPQVQRWDWPVISGKDSVTLRSPVLTMSTGVTVQCTVEERAKSEDFLITLELTSYDYEPAELAVNLKIAIWIKLMLAIRRLRKYPTRVLLDWRKPTSDGSIDEIELTDYVSSKLPFA